MVKYLASFHLQFILILSDPSKDAMGLNPITRVFISNPMKRYNFALYTKNFYPSYNDGQPESFTHRKEIKSFAFHMSSDFISDIVVIPSQKLSNISLSFLNCIHKNSFISLIFVTCWCLRITCLHLSMFSL